MKRLNNMQMDFERSSSQSHCSLPKRLCMKKHCIRWIRSHRSIDPSETGCKSNTPKPYGEVRKTAKPVFPSITQSTNGRWRAATLQVSATSQGTSAYNVLFTPPHELHRTSLVAQMVKNPPAIWETWVRFLGWESRRRRKWQPTLVFLPGESPWAEEPGGLQSMGTQTVKHNWANKRSTAQTLYIFIMMLFYT